MYPKAPAEIEVLPAEMRTRHLGLPFLALHNCRRASSREPLWFVPQSFPYTACGSAKLFSEQKCNVTRCLAADYYENRTFTTTVTRLFFLKLI
jgi:hypothetical protein